VSKLKSDGARLLYTWLIPNVDINGCFSGDEYVIKGQIFTRLKTTIEEVTSFLQDLHDTSLIIWYEVNDDKFLCIPDFADRQPSLNPSKEAKPTNPMPPQELLQTYSGVSPPKAKESEANESKEKGSKVKAKEASSFPQGDGISVVSQQLKFSMLTADILKCGKSQSDRTTLKNVAQHLASLHDGNDRVFSEAYKIAQECTKGRKPIALFMSRMKSEFDYRKVIE
jgi:hypothetical protein